MSEVEEVRKPTGKEKRKARRARKAERTLRLRWLKNLLWWLTGVISSFAILAGGIFVGIKVIPLKTYLGEDNGYVSNEMAESSALDAILNIGKYKFSDIPAISDTLKNLIESSGLDDYVTVDLDKLNNIQFSYEDGSTNIATELQGCLTVTATINSIGGTDMLGDFGKLSVLSDYEEVTSPVDTTAEDFNAKLYYYKTGETTYARAFTDEGELVEEADGQTLYLPALAEVPMVDLIGIMSDRMAGLKVKSMLECFSEVSDDNVVVKILGDRTIKDIGSFSAEEVLLKDVLTSTSDNQIIFDILCDAVVVEEGQTKPTDDEINLGHLENVKIDNVPLITVLPNDNENTEKLYNTLCSALSTIDNTVTASDIKVGDLKNLNTDNIALTSVLSTTGNETLYNILLDATGKSSANDIKILDLTSFEIKNVKLVTVLPSAENQSLYTILKDLTDTSDEGSITINSLSGITDESFKKIKLDNVLDSSDSGNSKLYDILCDVTGQTAEELTVGHLSGFNPDNLHIYKVLPIDGNETLFEIIAESAGNPEVAGETIEQRNARFMALKLSDMQHFNVTNIKLSTVLDPDSDDVKNDKILSALVNHPDVTIGTIGTAINDLPVSEVYGDNVWIEVDALTKDANKPLYTFNETEGTYTLDNTNGTYQISKDATVWLFLLYEYQTVSVSGSERIYADTNGNAYKYTNLNLTVKGLDDAVSHINDKVMGATIKQCSDAGIVDGNYSNINELTLQEVLDQLDDKLGSM